MKKTVWNVPPAVPIPEELLRAGYTPLLSAVLCSRGIRTAEAANAFFSFQPGAMEDPFLLTDMQKAVDRIRSALIQGETVAVYGDYDVDGITSACLLTEYLRGMGLTTEIYIPDRLEEGYGLNTEAIETLHNKGVSLIITVDCGITAVDETAFANSLGMDIIITDHHECQAVLPDAAAVVNPKRPDSVYPDRELAGVGVAYKLVCALSGDCQAMTDQFSDLVAVGTIADVMPLTGENRYIVKTGLDKLHHAPRAGLAALMDESGIRRDSLSASSIGFSIAPRINAAGRLGRVTHAAELILEKDPHRAAELAAELCEMNRERQRLEGEMWSEAEQMLEGKTPDGPIVLTGENWHQGVIGIAASRLSEAYSVPTVMISLDGDKGKGSCRSYGGFNLFEALSACGDLLETFGGHALAAGLNITRENIPAFRTALKEYYNSHLPTDDVGLSPDVLIDSPDLLTLSGVQSLEELEPCGSANPRPVFCMTDAVLSSVTPIGGGRHTSMHIEEFGRIYDCIWFGRRAEDIDIAPGEHVDIVFSPQISEFRGRRNMQLLMQAMRKTDQAALCSSILEGWDPGCSTTLSRGELARLWRTLEQICPADTELNDFIRLIPNLSSAKAALGLRVFSEVSLADVTVHGTAINISLLSHKGKADLMQSASWRKFHV